MKPKRYRGISLLAFLLLTGPFRTGSSFFLYTPEEAERREFYAISVVSEKDVKDASCALGRPDGRYAQIKPGGILELRMEENFIDLGDIVSRGETEYGIEGRFHVQETENKREAYAWMIIRQDPMRPGRFLFLPAYSLWENTGVNTIRISNLGRQILYLDSVIGYGKIAEKKRRAASD